uniref:Uncharacterized protein n=1 Tax=Musa acuminata subsp. malaccensis TaxID=214687 RepID=A0A804L4E5_MUSAM
MVFEHMEDFVMEVPWLLIRYMCTEN